MFQNELEGTNIAIQFEVLLTQNYVQRVIGFGMPLGHWSHLNLHVSVYG